MTTATRIEVLRYNGQKTPPIEPFIAPDIPKYYVTGNIVETYRGSKGLKDRLDFDKLMDTAWLVRDGFEPFPADIDPVLTQVGIAAITLQAEYRVGNVTRVVTNHQNGSIALVEGLGHFTNAFMDIKLGERITFTNADWSTIVSVRRVNLD